MKLFLFFMGLFLIGTIASACPCAPPPHHPPSGSNYWKGCVTVPRYGPTSCSNTTYCQLCSRDDDNVEHCYDLGETTGDLYTCFANYNFGNPEEPKDPVVNHPKYQCGSIINANQLTVGESIPIVGSDISLNYFTDRVPGYNHLYTFTQHIDPGLNETNLEKIHVTNTWLGVDNVTTYDPASEVEDLVFNWDGKDHQDQEVIASITTEIKVEYEYAGSIIQTQFITSATVGTYQAKAIGLGGWTLSNVHYLEKNRNTIYYGNGRSASVAPFKVNVNSNGEIERLANNNIFSNYLVSKEDKSEVYLFDLDGYHIETRSSRTNEVLLTINWNNGLLQSIEDSFGNITSISKLGNITTITAPNQKQTQIVLDAQGWASEIEGPLGNKYEMTYDSNGLLETFKNPKGLINSFDYDSKGNLLKDDNTAGHSWVFELLTNDPGSNLKVKSSSQMNREQITSTTYQGDGFTRQNLTKPSGAETRYIYNRYFRETRHPNGHTVGNSKTSDPRFFDQTHLNNALNINTGFINYFISYSYSAQYSLQNFLFLDSETSSHTFQNQTWQRIYDGVTGEYVYKSPLLREQKVKLNDYDQVIETQDTSFLPMSYSYDTLGRLSTISQGSRTWTYAYNADYEVESITNPKSEVISYEYDNNGRLIKSTLANSDEVTYSYDDNGNLTGIKAGSGPWHNFIVSAWDAVLSYVFPSIASETHEIEYEYNLDKQLTKVTKPGGIEIDYIYGASTGKLNQIVTPEGNYNYVYNLLRDQLTSLSSPDLANLSYMYNADELSRQRLVYNTLTTDTEFTYDSLLPESQTVKSTDVDSDESSTISYTYDGDRLLTGAGDLSLTRNLTTGLIEEVSLGSNMLETYTYDTSYPELSQMQAEHGTSSILSETYTRDALGRITDVAETTASTSATYTYEYDARGRLEKVYLNSNLQRHYFYDENSNRLKIEDGSSNVLVSATYDNQDRVTSYGDYTFTYTDYGHRNEKLNTATDIKEAIEYDSMGALVSYVKEDTSSSATLTEIDYINDGFGRRIQKTKDGLATKRYIYDAGIRLVGEVTPDGDTLTHYVYADKSHVPSYMIRGGNKYKLITNAQGSVRYVVNESTGSIEQEITYDEFGQVLSDSNPGFQSFGFAGGIYDPDTKLVRFGARDYDAETGRWTSKDPILFGGGDTNLYGYTFADPVNFIDPSGLIIFDNTGGHIPPEVVNSPLYQRLHNGPGRIDISLNYGLDAAGVTRHRGGLDQSIEINPNNQANRCDLADTYIHELNHADLNMMFNGRTSEAFDTNLMLPGVIRSNFGPGGICFGQCRR